MLSGNSKHFQTDVSGYAESAASEAFKYLRHALRHAYVSVVHIGQSKHGLSIRPAFIIDITIAIIVFVGKRGLALLALDRLAAMPLGSPRWGSLALQRFALCDLSRKPWSPLLAHFLGDWLLAKAAPRISLGTSRLCF